MAIRFGAISRHPVAIAILVGHLVMIAVLGMRFLGVLEPLELLVYDRYLRFGAEAEQISPPITLIGATEADLQRLGWPLSDDMLAQLIETLSAMEPAAIGIDIYRDIPIAPGEDRLAESLRTRKNVIWIFKFSDADSPSIPPPAVLAGTEQVGFADIIIDPGGIVRRGLLFLDDGQSVAFALSLRLALRYLTQFNVQPAPDPDDPSHLRLGNITLRPLEPDAGGYIGADARGYQYFLDFRGGAEPFQRYSVTDVLERRVDPTWIRDRVVIVGTTALSVKDNFFTPLSQCDAAEASMFGIVLHGHAVGQLIRHALSDAPTIASFDEILEITWLWLWSLAGSRLGAWLRSPLRFAFGAIGGVLALAVLVYRL